MTQRFPLVITIITFIFISVLRNLCNNMNLISALISTLSLLWAWKLIMKMLIAEQQSIFHWIWQKSKSSFAKTQHQWNLSHLHFRQFCQKIPKLQLIKRSLRWNVMHLLFVMMITIILWFIIILMLQTTKWFQSIMKTQFKHLMRMVRKYLTANLRS